MYPSFITRYENSINKLHDKMLRTKSQSAAVNQIRVFYDKYNNRRTRNPYLFVISYIILINY
ncbi:hypothetical protein RO3G_10513 [Rhizopus delemar RA 99-880]|uniref:Uncharacterized protein n=1 Tax=Rhizopus delemar (strain RA 99-880 / ATCC MYA-4621 / FGSC 9543 / NRRL 43880) TaxID=246409 RepID=I1CBH3_RHIO9|nr:hypothetical protein RO3G_10513 [Rhizopus delemar RA 99-880]|eukprot:EIE85803.1 hypothetical protein RO3G_10513 [Rhizopus delemar RA 99-880]